MLDVQRRPDVDAGGEQFVDVLPALGMAAAGHVGMGVFVDQQQARPARQRGVEVEFLHDLIAVDDRLARQDFEAFESALGLAPAVGLDQPDHDLAAAGLLALGGGQHRKRLADAWRRAEKNLQLSAAFLVAMQAARPARPVAVTMEFDIRSSERFRAPVLRARGLISAR